MSNREIPWFEIACITALITIFVLMAVGTIPVPIDSDCHSNNPNAC